MYLMFEKEEHSLSWFIEVLEVLKCLVKSFFWVLLIHALMLDDFFYDCSLLEYRITFYSHTMYHVKFINWNDIKYSSRKTIQLIMFLSRLLIFAKTRYWLTELKIVDIVWMLRKIRHLIEFSTKRSTIIYIDYDAALSIFKKISMTITSIDKLNFRLIWTFDYI